MKITLNQWTSILLIGIGATLHYKFYVLDKVHTAPYFLFFALFGIFRLIVPLFNKKP